MSTFVFLFCFAFMPAFLAVGTYLMHKDEPRPVVHRILVYSVVVPAIGLLWLVGGPL